MNGYFRDTQLESRVESRARLPTIREVVVLILGYCGYWLLFHLVWRPLTSPLRNLQCPPDGRGIMGHWPDMLEWVFFLPSPYLFPHDQD